MSLADEALLATDLTFQSRVRAAMLETCLAVAFESAATTNHQIRVFLAGICINDQPGWAMKFAGLVATDANVISDATVVGTVPLTALNLDTQAALVTDAHIKSAVTGQWGSWGV
jgi:hypothetical protein